MVEAEWTVPCLPVNADGFYGHIDMWVGFEGTDGRLIQMGIRASHYEIRDPWTEAVLYIVNEYRAWVVDTKYPATRTPYWMFPIDTCRAGATTATVNASVNRITGQANISAGPFVRGGSDSRHWYFDRMTTTRHTGIILERVGTVIPNFGVAGFREAKVSINKNGSTTGSFLGNSNVAASRVSMRSLLLIPGAPAVYTSGSDQSGNFNLTRYRFI
ncbi:hypothetical protein [Kibdelosporangium aridum]|uniref:hypothetical protein n=1 Tax=Kibdelosporangium aridum TaxID=2030 RepID=UPI000F792C1B|nr:hypothetical protein [Kibdelosporangium aridum]